MTLRPLRYTEGRGRGTVTLRTQPSPHTQPPLSRFHDQASWPRVFCKSPSDNTCPVPPRCQAPACGRPHAVLTSFEWGQPREQAPQERACPPGGGECAHRAREGRSPAPGRAFTAQTPAGSSQAGGRRGAGAAWLMGAARRVPRANPREACPSPKPRLAAVVSLNFVLFKLQNSY